MMFSFVASIVNVIFLVLLLCHNAFCEIVITPQGPIVQIESGSVRGTQNRTESGQTIYNVFRGIRYGQQPVRFTKPVKAAPWQGVYDGTQDGAECLQTDTSNAHVVGSEDCLFINVYVPQIPNTSNNLSVLVFIYGGAFMTGNSKYILYGPDYLLDRGVIFVSFNYRLGIYGFLSTNDSASPGNWGIHDQILALKWIQTNIASFGGNPSNVTISGESAGGASVAYIMQTKQAAGLFSGVILESASSLCLWSLTVRARRTAFAVGRAMGIYTTDSSELVARLRVANSTELQSASFIAGIAVAAENILMGLPWGPVKEPPNNDALFVGSSYDLLRDGDFSRVRILAGINSNEAAYAPTLVPDPLIQLLRAYLVNYDIHPENLPPYDLTSNYTKRVDAGTDIKQYFFNDAPFNAISLADLADTLLFISIDQFVRPVEQAVIFYSQYVPTYMYLFSYEGLMSGVTTRNYKGAGHIEELSYLYRSYYNYTDDDVVTRNRMCTWWTNFVKFGNPTPYQDSLFSNLIWPTVDPTINEVTVMNINKSLSIEQNPFEDQWQFYVENGGIYDRYGDGNYSTF